MEWIVGFEPNLVQKEFLNQLGLKTPTDYGELLTTFTAFRAVVNFYERKLKALGSSMERFKTIEKELQNRGT